jgi:sialic acid synthase SpsE
MRRKKIILDFSGGETCQNDKSIVKRMIDELKAVDTGKHEIIIKWQLFIKAPPVYPQPLRRDVFDYAYKYAKENGYKTTASVFDMNSLYYLLCYDIPFVKIACRKELYYIPMQFKDTKFVVSILHPEWKILNQFDNVTLLHCIPEYPATETQYRSIFGPALHYGISDHTVGLDMYNRFQPEIWEKHYKLEDSTGLDSDDFAITPKMLSEVL